MKPKQLFQILGTAIDIKTNTKVDIKKNEGNFEGVCDRMQQTRGEIINFLKRLKQSAKKRKKMECIFNKCMQLKNEHGLDNETVLEGYDFSDIEEESSARLATSMKAALLEELAEMNEFRSVLEKKDNKKFVRCFNRIMLL